MALVSVLKSVARQIRPELEGLNTSAQAFITQELGRYLAFELARKSEQSGSDGTEKAETRTQVVRNSPTVRAKRLRTIQRDFQAARRALQRLKKSIPKLQTLISETQASLRSCHLSPFHSALVAVAVRDVTKPREVVNSEEWLDEISATLQVTLTRIEKELTLIDSPRLKRERESEVVATSVDRLYYVLDRIFRVKQPYGLQLTIRESHSRITKIVGTLKLASVDFAAHGKAPAVEKAIQRLEPGVKKALDQRLYENLQIPPSI